eukprot:905692-Prorocentrum_minimum.AAC.5
MVHAVKSMYNGPNQLVDIPTPLTQPSSTQSILYHASLTIMFESCLRRWIGYTRETVLNLDFARFALLVHESLSQR